MTLSFTHMQTWRRPTLPRLKTKYHRRWGISRPSSEWDRVQPPRHYHQVGVCVNMTFLFGPALCRRFAYRKSALFRAGTEDH